MIAYALRRLGRALLTAAGLVIAVGLIATLGTQCAAGSSPCAGGEGAALLGWLGRALRLDFGRTVDNGAVTAAIASALPATVLLLSLAWLIGLVLGWGGGLLLASDELRVVSCETRLARYVKRIRSRVRSLLGPTGSLVRRPTLSRAGAQDLSTHNSQLTTHNSSLLRALVALAEVGQGVPTFWLGGLLVALFSVGLGLLPPGGIAAPSLPAFGTAAYLDLLRARPAVVLGDLLAHLILPALTLALAGLATDLRLVSTALSAELRMPHERAARGFGLSRRRLLWRAARPALAGVVGGSAAAAPLVASALVLVEYLFGWPGLGLLAYHAARTGDAATLQALLLLFGLAVIFAGLIADLLAAWADPRLREAAP